MAFDPNAPAGTALRVVLPVIYFVVALIGILGNFILLQIICANRFRHKSIHLLALSILFADLFFIVIFTVVRAVSYGYLNTSWFVNVNSWCKAEMYLLRMFEFILAYSIVFLCFDRAVKYNSCCYGVRKLRTGISIVLSIWLSSAYILIPILLFQQTISSQNYGGYLCYTTDDSVTLAWLGSYPRKVLDLIDIIFRIYLPICLMFILLAIGICNLCSTRSKLNNVTHITRQNDIRRELNAASSSSSLIANKTSLSNARRIYDEDDDPKQPSTECKLYSMALSYALLFTFCQLPYEIYRCILIWNPSIEQNLSDQGINYAIELPLLILKLVNRCANPFLFIFLADNSELRNGFWRCWICPCLPGCIGCSQCWCIDCWQSTCFECKSCVNRQFSTDENWVPTGLQTISTTQYRDGDKVVTKQKILEEYETGVEPYYKNPNLKENKERTNESFQNDDPYKVIGGTRIDAPKQEPRRIKL